MYKIVLDTNVLVSSYWGGNPREIINLWRDEKIVLCLSKEILDEYLELLYQKIKPPEDYRWFIHLIAEGKNTKIIKPSKHFEVIKEDPDDNKFLDCAVESKAKYIISGDEHLLKLKSFREIKILSPNNFLKKFGGK